MGVECCILVSVSIFLNCINLFTFQDIVPIFKLFYIVSYLNPFKTDSLKAKFWPAQKD